MCVVGGKGNAVLGRWGNEGVMGDASKGNTIMAEVRADW